MKFYWSTPILAETAHLPKTERDRIFADCHAGSFSKWQTWLGMVVLCICIALGSYIGKSAGSGILGAAMGGAVGGFIYSQFSIRAGLAKYREKYATTKMARD